MILGRPASHIVVALWFLVITIGISMTAWDQFKAGAAMAVGQGLFAVVYLVALLGLLSGTVRWGYYITAGMLFVFPAFIVLADIVIFFRVGVSSFRVVGPSLVGCAALLLLWYRFTFGRESRRYYGFAASDGGA